MEKTTGEKGQALSESLRRIIQKRLRIEQNRLLLSIMRKFTQTVKELRNKIKNNFKME